MSANAKQVGGDHYHCEYQHWDFVELNGIGYLEGCATKYVTRWRKKGGCRDLEKALHYVEKLMELYNSGVRNNRGLAPHHDIKRFAVSNGLTSGEHSTIIALTRWHTVRDLENAHQLIRILLEECDAINKGE